MNPERLLQHFEEISEAPDAVPRLRRFILDLAVRGKLVAQDPNDEPAGTLLERIEVEKKRQIKAGSHRNQTAQALDVHLIPFDIPDNWIWSQLALIGFINPRNEADDSTHASFVPMPLIFAKYGQANQHEVRSWGEIKKGFTHFAEGDVGLAKITPCFENGKSTVFRNLTGGLGAGTTELNIVRPIHMVADYILVFLKSSHFIETGIPKMTGTAGQKRVPKDYFAFSPFPLPPLAEQHRIVAKVDELMALCDELETARAQRETRRDRLVASTLHDLNNGDVTPDSDARPSFKESARFYFNHLTQLTTRPEHIKQLRQKILDLAVRGMLVAADPTDEPALETLDRINNHKEKLASEGQIRKELLPTPVDDETPFRIPLNWAWARIGNCSLLTEYGTSVKASHCDDGVPVLRMGDIQGGLVALGKKQPRVPKSIDDLPRLFLKHFDLLYNRTNSAELVGKTGIFLGDDDTYTFLLPDQNKIHEPTYESSLCESGDERAIFPRNADIARVETAVRSGECERNQAQAHDDPAPASSRAIAYCREGR